MTTTEPQTGSRLLDLVGTMDSEAAPPAKRPQAPLQKPPVTPGHEWDGTTGYIQTRWTPGSTEPDDSVWDDLIRELGMDPAKVMVVGTPRISSWDAQTKDGVERLFSYRAQLAPRGRSAADIDALVVAAKRGAFIPKAVCTDRAYVVALGDLQLGKACSDGLEGTVDRFFRALADSVERYVRQFRGLPVYVLYLGDCIEGFVSQGGANAWRTTATLTEQVRTYQRLVLEQVKAFADVAPRVVVAGVPGNHDEATRPLQKYGDSWAVQSLVAVHDALKLAGEAGQKFDHVEILVPSEDELTLTLDICGTRIAMAHGHQFGRGARGHITWWDGQMRGRQDPGTADVLLAGHRHHLHIETIGTAPGENARHFIQVPALEGESTWWRHRAGEGGEPGILTFSVGGGSWSDLQVHSYPVQPRG